MEPDGSFGAWMRELRRRLGLTQGELGKRVGRSPATVAQWELGRCDAGRAVRARLAELAAGAGLGPPPGPGDVLWWLSELGNDGG